MVRGVTPTDRDKLGSTSFTYSWICGRPCPVVVAGQTDDKLVAVAVIVRDVGVQRATRADKAYAAADVRSLLRLKATPKHQAQFQRAEQTESTKCRSA